MSTFIDELVALQAIDSEILALKKEAEERPKQIESEQKRVKAAEAQLAEIQSQMMEQKKIIDQKNLQIKQEDEKIKELQAKLNVIKTNKEYAAAQKEIKTHETQVSSLEEGVLTEMEKLDSLKNIAAESETKVASCQDASKETEDRLQKEIESIQVEISSKEDARSTQAEKVPANMMTLYTRLLGLPDGQAVVPVVSGSCRGCFITLPAQLVNELMKNDHMVQCKSCSRILYMES